MSLESEVLKDHSAPEPWALSELPGRGPARVAMFRHFRERVFSLSRITIDRSRFGVLSISGAEGERRRVLVRARGRLRGS
jgi:hypothetical protein